MCDRITEQNNKSSASFSEMDTIEMLRTINEQDKMVAAAVERALPAIAKAADEAASRLAAGGRMFYFGAGTSGRLGIIDASELRCTFGVDAEMVQAIIAGGPTAVYDAAMGDEDSLEGGASEIAAHGISKADVAVGITASGRTPYVLGALDAAKKVGALTIGICNNPGSAITDAVDVAIVADTGPEVIEGSTRMKAGTSQKMILNMLSTVIMARLGYVYQNYMVRMVPNNDKLFARAIHIVQVCTGAEDAVCEAALKESGWKIDTAIVIIACGVGVQEAEALLLANGRSVGRVL